MEIWTRSFKRYLYLKETSCKYFILSNLLIEIIHFNINLDIDEIKPTDEIHHIDEIHNFDEIHHVDEILCIDEVQFLDEYHHLVEI